MTVTAAVAAAALVPAAGAAAPARSAVPTTFITVNGDGGARVFDGLGAILGGGGNARYLEEYPAAQRAQILDYLFKPGYGASLQLLKLEIGGDGNSSDGAEPSIEHTAGHSARWTPAPRPAARCRAPRPWTGPRSASTSTPG
jgi:hypothetical protein